MPQPPAVEVDSVSKTFRLYAERNQSLKATVLRGRRSRHEDFLALNNVSFTVPAGSTFGITGNNGSGKSTLLKCIARILVPNKGTITTRGNVASLLELGSGFHPELTGRENVFLNAAVMRIPRSYMDEQYDALVEFAGIEDFMDQPVKTYSSGMYMRLAFSVAAHVDPDILLVDEVIAVGDAEFQAKCLQKFADLRRRGRTVIIASGALGTLTSLCDEVARLDHGKLVGLDVPDDHTPDLPGLAATVSPDAPSVITGLEVIGVHGFPVDRVASGEPVTLRLSYDAQRPIPKAVLVLELRTAAGVRAWTQHSRDSGLVPDPLAGRGSIDVRIPRLSLQSGLYEVRAAVADDALTEMIDARNFGFALEVTNDSLSEQTGLAVLGGQWANPVQDENLKAGGEGTG